MVSFEVAGVHHFDLGMWLDAKGVAVRTGHHCTQPLMDFYCIEGTARASFSVYNTIEEVDAFIVALLNTISKFQKVMSQTISDIQDEIIEEFSMLDGDVEMTIGYIMELGNRLPELSESDRSDDNIVKGCQSKVWLKARLDNEKVSFEADSNTAITKGLVSLLVRILSGRSPQEIIDADLYFIDKIGLNRFIGTQRSSGLGAMMKQIKIYGLAFSTQTESTSSKK